jgi:cell wall-associated NlpC family hydrolase
VTTLRFTSRATSILLTAVLFAATAVSPVTAATLADTQAKAAAVQAQLTALEQKVEVAGEAYNSARDNYDAITVKVRAVEATVRTLDAKTNTLQTALGNRADAMYRNNDTLGFVEALLSARSIEDLNSTIELLTRISEQDAATVAQLKQTRLAAEAAHRTLAAEQASALVQRNAMAANAAQARAAVAARTAVLAGLQAEIKKIIAAQAAAAAAAAQRRWNALHSGGGGFIDPGGNPPTDSKAALAVWWAEKELGKPYSWGASGPNSFDCSGLTKWAWGHAGVSLPHYSGAQIGVGSRVSVSNLQPGDLVFFGHPIHHVGMYVGHGDFIEAPYTGADVRISNLADRMGDYAGASRP